MMLCDVSGCVARTASAPHRNRSCDDCYCPIDFLKGARSPLAIGFCGVIPDWRDPTRVVHPLPEILLARILAIARGYENAEDLDALRLVLHAAAYWLILAVRDAIPKAHALAKAEITIGSGS